MDENTFKQRTKRLALDVIRLVDMLPRSSTADVLARQLIRSATSVGANYRAACRSRSTADMINKLRVVEEEADESIYWMELLTEANIIPVSRVSQLTQEAGEIVVMTVASINTLRSRSTSATRVSLPSNRTP